MVGAVFKLEGSKISPCFLFQALLVFASGWGIQAWVTIENVIAACVSINAFIVIDSLLYLDSR